MIMHITERDMAIVRALAKNNLAVTNVAKMLFMHRNTVLYHIRKIERLTGLNPLNFFDLMELMGCIEKIPCEECRFNDKCIRLIETIDGDKHNHHRLGWCSKAERKDGDSNG